MIDRYTKFILTVIAGALLYLAAIFTPLPGAHAQTPSRVPGVSSGPTEVVIVGWQAGQAVIPVAIGHPVQVMASKPLPITGQVTTERSSDRADRVILVGWEENAVRDGARNLVPLSDDAIHEGLRSLPVQTVKLPR